MYRLNCIIVDDEPLAVKGIEMYLKNFEILNLIGTFTSALKSKDFLKKHKIDLVFLDIEMPNLTGFEVIDSLKNPPFIIITTAYPQYVTDAFELNVIDYLLKPISL